MSSPDEHPRCLDVFNDPDLKFACLNLCACYRAKRKTYDPMFCANLITNFSGQVGHCTFTRQEITAAISAAKRNAHV